MVLGRITIFSNKKLINYGISNLIDVTFAY